MKKFRIFICAVIIILSLTGCGGNKNRILYNVNLTNYIDLAEYKGISVDTSSDEFKEYYNDIIAADVEENGFYVKKTEGVVESGDTANIDYEGKKDEVAFEGGTAAGYDLQIGSGSFIEGFEEGLIGVQIGSTVNLNLTFPEDYQSEELAGQAVVFTVKVNYVTTDQPMASKDYYSELDFKDHKSYTDDVTKRAVKNYLLDKVKSGSKIKKYPEKDQKFIYDAYKNLITQNIQSNYNIDFETYLGYMNQTEEDFKEDLTKNQIIPEMDKHLTTYAIFDKEKLTVTKAEIDKKATELAKKYGAAVTVEQVLEYYGEYYFEVLYVNDEVSEILYKSAKIK